MNDPQYLRTSLGVQFQSTSGQLGPPLQHPLTLLYDREEGALIRHGEKPRIEAHFHRLTVALRGTELHATLEMLEIPLDQLTPAVLQYVNHAIATAGYITTLLRLFGGGEEPATAGED